MRSPPPTKRERTSYERHGDLIHDPYLWLEEDTGAVDEWVRRQNEYADEYLESIEVREELRPRFESYARTTEYGSIVARPTGYFQEVEDADDDQPVLTLRESLEDDREVLLDPNEWSDDATVSIGWWTVSPDGTLLAYGVDEGGDEQYDVTIFDVAAREPIDELPDVGRAGPPAWTPDGIYYYRTGSAEDGAQLEKTVLYHEFGTDPADDTELLTVEDPGTWPAVQTDRAGDHLLLSLSIGWERTELFYAPVGESELSPVLTDTQSIYEPLIHDGRVYLGRIVTHPGIDSSPSIYPVRRPDLTHRRIPSNTIRRNTDRRNTRGTTSTRTTSTRTTSTRTTSTRRNSTGSFPNGRRFFVA